MTLIDLSAARERRDGPDPEFVWIDGRGQKWFAFAFGYEVDGREFGFQIWALNHADAERRLEAIRATGRVAGKVFAEVSGP